jgi:hypothetical protein
MYPLTHFLAPFLVGLILVNFGYFTFNHALIAGLIGLLIDVDHFLYYFTIKRDFNFKNAWNSAVNHKFEERTFIHHLPGFLIFTTIIIALFFINKTWFLILTIGYYLHMVLDYFNFKSWLRIKQKVKFNEEGFVFKIPLYEIILDLILIFLIIIFIF